MTSPAEYPAPFGREHSRVLHVNKEDLGLLRGTPEPITPLLDIEIDIVE